MTDFEKKLTEELAKQMTSPMTLPLQAISEAIAGHIKSWRWVHQGRLKNKKSDAEIDEIIKRTTEVVQEKVNAIPAERLQLPPLLIYGPTIEALSYTADEPTLRDMFANLLAQSMDTARAGDAHPSYVEIIKQINPQEAQVLKFIADTNSIHGLVDVTDETGRYVIRNFLGVLSKVVDEPLYTHKYLDNLVRLKLLDIDINDKLWEAHKFDLDYLPWFGDFKIRLGERKNNLDGFSMNRKVIFLSDYGKSFVQVCLDPKSDQTLK